MMDTWDAIRSLDEEENWTERNRVLSKADHLENIKCAKEIVENLVDHLPIPSQPPSQNHSEFDPQNNSEFDYMNEFTDADFQSSAAQFDVDYLENLSTEASADPSDLARKSLFVKFDPLVGTQSPRGKAVPPVKQVNRQHLMQQSQEDLLLLGTPPNSGLKMNAQKNEMHSQSSFFSPLGSSTADPNPHPQPTIPSMDEPETEDLVKVLKYSDADLPGMLESVHKEQRSIEEQKYESQIMALRQQIAAKREQLQQDSKKKESFHSRSVLLVSTNEKAEQDLHGLREKVKSHAKKHSDLQAKHEEFKKDVSELDEQLELIGRDSAALENAFDTLHQQYVQVKAVHQVLSERSKVLQQYSADLKSWTQEDTQNREQIQAQLRDLEQKAETDAEALRRENASKMTVEKAKALKLKMELENLEKDYQRKEEEKQQVSQICDELMREMEATQQIG